MRERLPNHIDFDDLVSLAYLGLVRAAEKFDPARGCSFGTYARYRIRGEILDKFTGRSYPVRMEGLDIISDDFKDENGDEPPKKSRALKGFHQSKDVEEDAINAQRKERDDAVLLKICRLLEQQPDKTLAAVFTMRIKGHSQRAIAAHFGYSQDWGHKRIRLIRAVIGENFGAIAARTI